MVCVAATIPSVSERPSKKSGRMAFIKEGASPCRCDQGQRQLSGHYVVPEVGAQHDALSPVVSSPCIASVLSNDCTVMIPSVVV